MFKTRYEFPLSENYVEHWGLQEALREIFQNALDSENAPRYFSSRLKNPDSPRMLRVLTPNVTLSESFLVLGETTKRDDDSKIGAFGEGFKIALLVLCRGGFETKVYNGKYIWTPSFEYSKKYKRKIFYITKSKNNTDVKDLCFEIKGISKESWSEMYENNINIDPSQKGEVFECKHGEILKDHKGKLFVNGLFVCKTELTYGYNIKPIYLKLGRDRQSVSSFDLEWLVAQMWNCYPNTRFVAEQVLAASPDFKYISNFATPTLADECFKLFSERYPDYAIAATQEEAHGFRSSNIPIAVLPAGFTSIVKSSRGYSHSPANSLKGIKSVLQDWFNKHSDNLTTEAIEEYNAILYMSSNWTIK